MSEVQLGVYDVFFEFVGEYDCGVEFVRVVAEDEEHAVEKARARQYMPYGASDVVYRGEA